MAHDEDDTGGSGVSAAVSEDESDRLARARMVEIIAAEVAETSHWLARDHLDPRVMAAMAEVPRHAFVPAHSRGAAYENRPLPIGHGQTISQPYIVAIMTDLSGAGPGRKVLEVWTIETVPALAQQAAFRLAELGYDGIRVRHGDGSKGWPEEAPFDGILVTAAASRRPPAALIEQLAPGGHLVIPVEHRAARFSLFGGAGDQELLVIAKNEDGSVRETCHLPVAFVPLIEGIEGKTGPGDG